MSGQSGKKMHMLASSKSPRHHKHEVVAEKGFFGVRSGAKREAKVSPSHYLVPD